MSEEITEETSTQAPVKPKKKGKVAQEGPITLRWKLAELPSAQHRAGLAGLVLMVQWLDRQGGEKKGVCRLIELDERGVGLEVDLDGLRRLFDELYAASVEESVENQARKHKITKEVIPPIRTDEKVTVDEKGKEKRKTVYVYPTTVPRGGLLVSWEPNLDNNGLWIRLWRSLIWSVIRGVPATRRPFESRAEKEPTDDAERAWTQLTDEKNPSVELPSTYYLGAQSSTAESVGFQDRARTQFLLHFWPYVIQIYVPQTWNTKEGRADFAGYAVVVPDVSELRSFVEEMPYVMQQRTAAADRYRPREAVVDIAVESALDTSLRLRESLTRHQGAKSTANLVQGFEVLHVDKEGNNVRVYSSARFAPEAAMVDEYALVQKTLRDLLFRRQRLINLVKRRPWFEGFDRVAGTMSFKILTGRVRFAADARHTFEERSRLVMTSDESPGTNHEEALDVLVYKMIRNYVNRKVESKTGLRWDAVPPGKRREVDEAREKIARQAFLDVRSRSGSDFEGYFAGTLCSVPQFIKPEDFTRLSAALRKDGDNLRTLTLLALSAASWTRPESKTEETK